MGLEIKPNKLELNIESTPVKAFEQYLSLVNPIVPDKLKPFEIRILACLMYFNHMNRNLSIDDRNSIVFSKETKRRICRKLVISEDAVNNVMSSLYRKKYLSKNRKFRVFMPFDGKRINLSYSIGIIEERDLELEAPLNDKDNKKGLF